MSFEVICQMKLTFPYSQQQIGLIGSDWFQWNFSALRQSSVHVQE